MATTTKKRAKKPAKTAVKKAAKKGVPTLKQLLVRTEKVQAGGGDVVITDLESSGGAKIIQPLVPERG